MPKNCTLFSIAISVSVLGCIIYGAYYFWRQMNETGYMSCIAALTDTISGQDAAKEIQARNIDWKILDDSEFDLVMSSVKGNDCKGIADPKLDLQQQKIHIALRKKVEGRWPSIIIWSDGRDGVSNTDDDIVMPYGQKIPSVTPK